MIVGQNALLNQYVPTFYIKDLRDGQGVVYDSVRKAFVNVDINGGSAGANRLGELLDVSDSVDNPLALQNGQSLIYNTFTSLWENRFTDYNTLLNAPVIPTNNSFSFAGLSDTATPALPDGYVKWNSTGTELIYSTTIPASSITGLATVAITGDYNDLINKPAGGTGTVTNVSFVSANGVSGVVTNPTTTPAITVSLGNITPTSIASTGTVTGSNISGTNTGDQTITLTGDISGTGTGSFATTLATVNSNVGTFGNATTVPQVTVDGKGRVTGIVNVPISTAGVGTVTSVSATGTQGVTTLVLDTTTTPSITIGLGNITPTGVAATGTVTGTNLSGTNTGDQTITLTGDISGTGTGSFATTLANSGVTANTYGSATQVPVFTVDSKGRITGVTNTTISGGAGTVTSVAASGGTTGLTFTGSPITTSGTLTLSGTLSLANGGTGATTQTGAANAILPTQTGQAGRYLTTNGTTISWATVPSAGVTSVGVSSTTSAISVANTPVTSTGTISLTANNFTTSTPGVVPASGGGTTNFLRADGTWAAPGGAGTVTSVAISGTDGITSVGGPVTSSGTFTLSLTDTGVSAGTYGSATDVPVFTVDSNGRISSVTNVPVSGGSTSSAETVVFKYSSGGAGNLAPVDAIVSQTAGVTTTIIDGVNCLVEFSFNGKTTPPTTVLMYGQNFSANTFALVTPPGIGAAGANYRVAGGGTSANPDIINGIFAVTNVLRLQLRMVDVGASSTIGNRTHCLVRFGF